MKNKYQIGQLAEIHGEFGRITAVVDRGNGAYVYEISGQESFVAEEAISNVYVPYTAPAPRVRKPKVLPAEKAKA